MSEMSEPTIRLATPEDAPALLAIYEPYVRETAITCEYEVPSVEEFAGRIERTLKRYPYLVMELDGRPVATPGPQARPTNRCDPRTCG